MESEADFFRSRQRGFSEQINRFNKFILEMDIDAMYDGSIEDVAFISRVHYETSGMFDKLTDVMEKYDG